jgi:hypothetical protein
LPAAAKARFLPATRRQHEACSPAFHQPPLPGTGPGWRLRHRIAANRRPSWMLIRSLGALRRSHRRAWPLSRCLWFRRAGLRSLLAAASMIQRPSSRTPSGRATHTNHRLPLAPLTSHITKTKRLIASQDLQAARHAGENQPGRASTDPPERRPGRDGLAAARRSQASGSCSRSVPGRSAIRLRHSDSSNIRLCR